jgi:hypothetical protein
MDLAASALGVIPCGSGLFEKYNGQSLTGKCVDNVVGMLNEADENNVEFGIDWISRTIKADKDAASLYKECVGLKDGGPAECTPDSTDTKSCCDSNGYGRGIVRDFSIIVGAVIRMIAAKAEDFVMNDFDDEYKVMKERSFKPGGFGVLDEDSSVWSRVTDSCIGMLLISNDAELIHRIPHSKHHRSHQRASLNHHTSFGSGNLQQDCSRCGRKRGTAIRGFLVRDSDGRVERRGQRRR